MFTTAERDRVRDHLLEVAHTDDRIVAAAVVGSLALGPGDRWSDLDLTFGIADDVTLADVMDDWTADMDRRFDAVLLFDLFAEPALYRVFLLADCLQVDLSFAPASKFRATSPRFRLLFGEAGEVATRPERAAQELLGTAVMFARDGRVCIERERWWQAEHSITNLRYNALSFACRRRDLPSSWGKGFDKLPADVLEDFRPALVRSLDRDELARALTHCVGALVRELRDDPDADPRLPARLDEIVAGLV